MTSIEYNGSISNQNITSLLSSSILESSDSNRIKDKKEIILPSLYTFFKKDNNIERILPIISGYSNLSIRVLDWFVTNYAKNYNVIYTKKDGDYFNVYLDYKSQLKGYRKKMFDPFCRKRRIPFYYSENKCVITTIGQLNFFRWAIENNVIDYVENNLGKINDDMNSGSRKLTTTSEDQSTSETTSVRIKKEKSSINIHKAPFQISLNN